MRRRWFSPWILYGLTAADFAVAFILNESTGYDASCVAAHPALHGPAAALGVVGLVMLFLTGGFALVRLVGALTARNGGRARVAGWCLLMTIVSAYPAFILAYVFAVGCDNS